MHSGLVVFVYYVVEPIAVFLGNVLIALPDNFVGILGDSSPVVKLHNFLFTYQVLKFTSRAIHICTMKGSKFQSREYLATVLIDKAQHIVRLKGREAEYLQRYVGRLRVGGGKYVPKSCH